MMNETFVPNALPTAQDAPSAAALAALESQMDGLTPQLRKAAVYALENPHTIGVSSIREIADAAGVKPNSFVRMARAIGFEGFDGFRAAFREEIRNRHAFPDRAAWLQSLARDDQLGGLFAQMAASAISNIEDSFLSADPGRVKAAADRVIAARRTFVLGVGVNLPLAEHFAYLGEMALDSVEAIPRAGRLAVDEAARVEAGDVLIAMTFRPWRADVIDAVAVAQAKGAQVIALSDSRAAPIMAGAAEGFVVSGETPHFFPSSVAALALLELLMAFIVADSDAGAVAKIRRMHERRHATGVYRPDLEDG